MKRIYGLIILSVVVATIASIIIILAPFQGEVEYSGVYSREIKEYYSSIGAVDNVRKVLKEYTRYCIDDIINNTLYNNSIKLGTKAGLAVDIVFHEGEAIVVYARGNSSIYYTLSLDKHLVNPILRKYFVNDTVINFTETTGLQEAYIVFFSDNNTYANITIYKDIWDYNVLLKYYRLELSLIAINMFLARYNISHIGDLEALSSSRSPLDIFKNNATTINEYEAVALASMMLKSLNITHVIGVIDTDNDQKPDHLSLLVKLNGTAEAFLRNLTMLYTDLGRDDVIEKHGGLHVKYVIIDKDTYLIIDPLYVDEILIPGHHKLPKDYKMLGIIKT